LKRHGSLFDHIIELLLIVTIVGISLGLVGLVGWVFLPQVSTILGSGAPAVVESELPESTPTLGMEPTPTVQFSLTPTPSLLPPTSTPTLEPSPLATNIPSPTNDSQIKLSSSSFTCDRPGWFPKNIGVNEHTLVQIGGEYIVFAARQPFDHRLFVARSSDLCHWETLPDILSGVQNQSWDGRGVDSPFVIEQDGTYYLYYTAATWPGTERILWATSDNPQDSDSWQVQGEAFRPNHAGEFWPAGSEAWCRDPMVLKDGDLYYLYYVGRDEGGGIIGAGVASSLAGPWKDLGAVVPVLDGQDYDSPFVVAHEGTYYLFYHHPGQGTQYRISDAPLGPWSEPYDLAPGWAHEVWQADYGQWFTSFLTDYTVTIFPLKWDVHDGVVHPEIITPSPFLQDVPIWSHAGEPSLHEVNLFRHTFVLDQPLDGVELALFADTRYEAWLDGVWLGRGPARFSYQLREYDVYNLDQLEDGQHTLAVLVQWSPNTRRSESIAPFLQGHLRGTDTLGEDVIIRTSADWKVQRSPAWQADAALVHSWGLIGSTELLDLSQLPMDWNQLSFEDQDWGQAVVINPLAVNYQPHRNVYLGEDTINGDDVPQLDPEEGMDIDLAGAVSGVTYRPRSIPLLENVPMPIKVLDAGYFSPGQQLVEIPASVMLPYDLPFWADEDTYLTLEAPGIVGPAVSILVDGKNLAWLQAGDDRPQVYQARTKLFTGAHKLTVVKNSKTGLTFSVSTERLRYGDLPFSQGLHAGRRILMGKMVSDSGQFIIAENGKLSVTAPAGPTYLVLDLGRTVYGRLIVDVDGSIGTIIDIGWDERLVPDTTRPLPFPGSLHKEWDQVDSWVLDGNPRQLTTIDGRSGRYIMIVIWNDDPVVLKNIQVLEERYPLELRGSFVSSDPLLNQIWQVGMDTLYSNMNDAYTDTSWRERGQWWGDVYVADHINRVTFGDFGLIRRSLEYVADSYRLGFAPGLAPNSSSSNMTDYMMLWVQNLAEYVQLSGDLSILKSTYPVLQEFMAQMATYEKDTTGLLSFPKAHWWKYVYIDTFGGSSRYGQSTAVNSIYYGTLLQAAYLAEQAGDLTTALWWHGKAEKVYENANSLLYAPTKEMYLGTYYLGYYEKPNVHAQVWPLAYGLTTDENIDVVADAALELISDDPLHQNIGIYGFYWVFDGLGHAGYIEDALALIKAYYGHMLGRGATTWWERMDADTRWTQSQSHAWGGSPTWFLTTYVLGARATGPDTWELRPALTGVESVSGVIPLLNGKVQTAWQQTECGTFEITMTPDDGLTGMLYLQSQNLTEVTMNGMLIWDGHIVGNTDLILDDEFLQIPIKRTRNVVAVQDCQDINENADP